MKFPELEIQNFLAITEAKLNLSDRGLVLIQGDNQADSSADSNGAGKSTLPDALCWCWFGTTARGVSGDDVINRDAKKDCFVRSVVVDGHMTYTAIRHRKHKTGKNTFTLKQFDGIKETDLTKGKEALTQIEANRIIGSSLEVFSASIYAGQEQMPDLPGMTDKNLKVLIEEASGASLLEGAHKKAREGLNAAEKDLVTAQATVTRITNELTFVRSQLTQTTANLSDWETNKGVREADVKAQIAPLVPVIKKLRDDLAALDKTDLEAKIAVCDSKIGLVEAEKTGLASLERTLSQANSQLVAAEQEVNMLDRWKGEAEAALAKVEHQVGCPCSGCGRTLGEAELGTAKLKAQELIDDRVKAGVTAASKVAIAKTLVEDAQRARDDFAATMTNISAVAAQRSSYDKQLAAYYDLEREHTSYVNQAKTLRDKMIAIQAETNPHKTAMDQLTKKAGELETELTDAQARQKEQEETVAIEAEVVKIYGPAGVRATILDDVTPFLNSQTAKYLTILSDGNIEATWNTLTPDSKGNLKEKFTIDVNNATGGESFRSLSGGEKRKVRISTALALQDLVATRATKPIDLFIGDEIDDALDGSGLERLMQILEEKARERGTVMVISHNELKDFIKQVLLVEKLPNKTTKITEMAA